MPLKYVRKRVKIGGKYFVQVFRYVGSYRWTPKRGEAARRKKRMLFRRRERVAEELKEEQKKARLFRSMAVWEVDTRDSKGKRLEGVYRVRIYTAEERITRTMLQTAIQEVFDRYAIAGPSVNEAAFEMNREIDKDEMEPSTASLDTWYEYINVQSGGRLFRDEETERRG